MRSFHGHASFYRRLIPHFNSIMVPLIDCVKGTKFFWTADVAAAFQEIKQPQHQFLSFLIFAQPFELYYDASKTGIGVVLSQSGRAIACFNEKLSGAKLRFSIYDVDFYAVLQAVKH